MQERAEWAKVKNFLYHLIFVRNAYISNVRLLTPFLHVEKFVGGWWLLKCILVLSFRPKLNNFVFVFTSQGESEIHK